jgi:hypothetical protein
MLKRILLILCFVLLDGTGCATAPPIRPDDPEFPTVEYLKEHNGMVIGQSVLAPRDGESAGAFLPFRMERVWNYAARYADGGNNCAQGQLASDCAHFQAHALAAAGVKVLQPSAVCDAGFTLRVRDLAIAFDNASRRYQNVKKFSDYHQARRGDYCFLPRSGTWAHDHLMLLAAVPQEYGAKVYSHTNNRHGAYVPFDVPSCLFYRIEDR